MKFYAIYKNVFGKFEHIGNVKANEKDDAVNIYLKDAYLSTNVKNLYVAIEAKKGVHFLNDVFSIF